MKNINLDRIAKKYHHIELQNGKVAVLYNVSMVKVKQINPDKEIRLYRYYVPCPLCDYDTEAYSYDGQYFQNIQINCKNCGIFFRPVIKRK